MGKKPTSSVAQTDLDADDDCGGVRPDIMAMCLRLLAMYMRQLMLDGDDPPPSTAGRRGTAARAAPPADSCGARLRDGSPCRVRRWKEGVAAASHGCAPRAGAPKGNRNALKHGCFSAKEICGRAGGSANPIRSSQETMRRLVNEGARGHRAPSDECDGSGSAAA